MSLSFGTNSCQFINMLLLCYDYNESIDDSRRGKNIFNCYRKPIRMVIKKCAAIFNLILNPLDLITLDFIAFQMLVICPSFSPDLDLILNS